MEEWKRELNVELYAYCLMSNYIHLILNPGNKPERVGLLMKRLAGRQTRYINKLEGRSGSLWEGRYKISPIDTDNYLLQCCRYVDLNSVKAGLVIKAEDYPWSSYRLKVGLEQSTWLDSDVCYLALKQSAKTYREFVEGGVSRSEHAFIRTMVERNQLTGSDLFID